MNKYDYNLKLEEIDKLVDQGDYEEAARMADTIDWRMVRNVRTLSMVSEIYEAAGKPEKSKEVLLRAYKRSPVGRDVLYRLVEVTTILGQYDEALEYYLEYVQVAPHDNNRYILKYNIYKGRGSSVQELIPILEEYLGQEYTERWAFELASLYQEAGQIQKCLAACDDLVLWFRSGKYVKKALELKKRYSALTPKQQQIYEECLQDEAQIKHFDDNDYEDEGYGSDQTYEEKDDEAIAENIIAETEKEIAGEVSARRAKKEKEEKQKADQEGKQPARRVRKKRMSKQSRNKAPLAEEEYEQEYIDEPGEDDIPEDMEDFSQSHQRKTADARDTVSSEQTMEYEPLEQNDVLSAADDEEDQENLQEELARSVSKLVAGIARTPELDENDVPAAVEDRFNNIKEVPKSKEPEPSVPKRSIDDILLSMGEKGRQEAENARARRREAEESGGTEKTEETDTPAAAAAEEEEEEEETVAPAAAEEETVGPAAAEEEAGAPAAAEEETGTPAAVSDEETISELTEEQLEALKYASHPAKYLKKASSLPKYNQQTDAETVADAESVQKDVVQGSDYTEILKESGQPEISGEPHVQEISEEADQLDKGNITDEAKQEDVTDKAEQINIPNEDTEDEENEEYEEDIEDEEEGDYYDDPLTVEPNMRELFDGFLEVEGLEDQIANAILQALAKGDDRTSRTGNILIFGSHGSGKTTMATGIAKAIAMGKGRQVAKMAKIYAADLNRKDIAATIAKIANGVLIIEEAGDLDDKTLEQLTTAMEFRTDGLVIILEDEQRFVHDLLMKHPRFTMKFTAQIYIPEYTADELASFGQKYAAKQDYVISDEGLEVIRGKISEAASAKSPLSVGDITEMVDKAIRHSNKFMRKMSVGKKRYDENDSVVLYGGDFK